MLKFSSLTAKLNFFFLANALCILIASLFFVNEIMGQVGERQILKSVLTGKNTIQQFLKNREERLIVGASLMVTDYAFKQAYSSDDRETIISALENLKGRISANFVSLVDLDGGIYASTMDHREDAKNEIRILVSKYEETGEAESWTAMRVLNGRLFQVVFVPFMAPDLVKWTAVGFEIDDALVNSFKTISDTEIIFTVRSPDSFKSFASTLDAPSTATAMGFLEKSISSKSLMIGSRLFYVAESGLMGATSIAVLKDASEVSELMRRAMQICLGIFFVLLASSVFFSSFISKLISRPIQEITDKSIRLAGGELDVDLTTNVGDESVRELSRSLQKMTTAIKSEMRKKIEAMQDAKAKQSLIKAVNVELQRKAQENALLVEIVGTIQDLKSPEAVFNFTLDRIIKHFDFDRMAVLGLAHKDKCLQPLVVRTKTGMDPNFEKIKALSTGLSLVDLSIPELRYLFHHMPLEWSEALAKDSYVLYEERITDSTFMAIPLKVAQRSQGFLHIVNNRHGRLSEADINLLCSVADLLAGHVEKAPRYFDKRS